jgi:diaminohydroxyphosphoribosylaminopyrimidine deaminase/5-amino-6-(5-phosphoribosylamino)uracil reductase
MDKIWAAILNLKQAVDTNSSIIKYCWIDCKDSSVYINETPLDKEKKVLIICHKNQLHAISENTTFVLSEDFNATPINQIGMGVEEIMFLKKYLPYCFLAIKSKKLGRSICVTHFAQTLDAKIATGSGDSKWIGNQENLIHAHRMRALCNGVLVGSRTVEHDSPRLNVRHVKGRNPIKIVLGHPKSDLKSLLESSEAPVLMVNAKSFAVCEKVQQIQLKRAGKTEAIAPLEILKSLYQQNIYSIYLEGGAKTTSTFINSKAVDILQLHIAPLIFGSGKASIELPTIEAVKEAISFKEFHFLPFGDHIMFTGFLGNPNPH